MAARASLLLTCPECPSFILVWQWWDRSKRGVSDPHENLYPLRRSKLTGNMVYFPWLPSMFHLLVVGDSAPCWSFNAASLIPWSKLPPALLIFSVPHLPAWEKGNVLVISGFLHSWRFTVSDTSSRFPGPLWAEERDITQFSEKKGRQLLGGSYFGAQVRKLWSMF